MAFVWGQAGEKLTPQDIERRRDMIAAAAARGSDTSPVAHWTQGLARLVDAFGAYRGGVIANKAEQEGRANARAQIEALLGGGGNLSMSSMGGAPKDVLPVVGGEVGFAGQAPSAPVGDMAERLRMRMIEQGLPPHVAEGFLMNFQDESGLNPGINERNPTVPGSRGGFGLYQLTGPRRVAYERFAAERGVPASDTDAQLAFMMQELQGPEAKAAQAIMAAPDAGSAAAAIATHFLRPAPEHLQRRVAAYTGGRGYEPSSMASRGADGGMSPVTMALLQASADPWVAQEYGPVLQALMGQEQERQKFAMQQADPLRQLQMQKAQLELEQMRNPAPESTAMQQNVQWLMSQGMSLPDAIAATKGGVTVNTGSTAPQVGTIPQGYQLAQDPASGAYRMEPIPGGPAEAELRAAQEKKGLARNQQSATSDMVSQDIDRAIGIIDQGGIRLPATGAGANWSAAIGGTDANDLRNLLDTVKANAAFDTLSAMRAASPTGGALGAVSDTELRLLAAAKGALEQSQSSMQLKDNLNRLYNVQLDIIHGPGNGPPRRKLSFEKLDIPDAPPEGAPVENVGPMPDADALLRKYGLQ